MIIVPAIDLFEGKAVRLRQGKYEDVTVFDVHPATRAAGWRGRVPWLHVVDLEGARAGAPVQREAVRAIVEAFGPGAQVGGGVRSRESFEAYLALGVARVVLGSAAVKDPAMVKALASDYPGRVVVAVDARDGLVAIDGWTSTSRVRATDLVTELAGVPLAGVLYTDVLRDGMRDGPNVEATAALAKLTKVPVIASGGVGSLDDLRALAAEGIAACIVGRALYESAFTLEEAIAAGA
ncbi:MAG TPA: 1-(5-phosphoribosyl)-5-[(5-phosphoribosylamino)methylideneamino]imidazole-4-carboxamide isomerase [Polyangiaceae bacterium]|jgi:phosphoribosylformimino-5-aminoimidazole carboxamide ribotide isomerase